jgi:hypothetical protein
MGGSSSELPVLIAQTGVLNGHKWLINHSLMLGRDNACDVIIPDRQVSRYHARITPDSKGVLLEDLGSKNGTHVNGKLIDFPLYLQDGDILAVALVQNFTFLSSDATMPMIEPVSISETEQRGRLRMDYRSRRVWINSKEVIPPLSVPQFKLLQILYDQQEKVVPRQDLIAAIWGSDDAVGISEQAMDALVRRLRDRLSALDPTHLYIITIRGHGLRLNNPQE